MTAEPKSQGLPCPKCGGVVVEMPQIAGGRPWCVECVSRAKRRMDTLFQIHRFGGWMLWTGVVSLFARFVCDNFGYEDIKPIADAATYAAFIGMAGCGWLEKILERRWFPRKPRRKGQSPGSN